MTGRGFPQSRKAHALFIELRFRGIFPAPYKLKMYTRNTFVGYIEAILVDLPLVLSKSEPSAGTKWAVANHSPTRYNYT